MQLTEHNKLFYFLRKLKKAKFPCQVLVSFYRKHPDILCTAQDRRALQRVIKNAQKIIGTHLPSISDIGEVRCLRRAKRILKDSTHPATACSPCCLLGKDIEVSAATPPDCRAAFPPRSHQTLKLKFILSTAPVMIVYFCYHFS